MKVRSKQVPIPTEHQERRPHLPEGELLIAVQAELGHVEPKRSASSKQAGFTVLEIVVVIVVIGILAVVSSGFLVQTRPDAFANSVSSSIQNARFEAIKRNRAVAFVWNDNAKQFVVRVKNATASAASSQSCGNETGDVTLRTINQSDYRGVRVTNVTFLQDTSAAATAGGATLYGFVWQPHGLPKRCNATSLLTETRSFGFGRTGSATVANTVTLNPAGMVSGTP